MIIKLENYPAINRNSYGTCGDKLEEIVNNYKYFFWQWYTISYRTNLKKYFSADTPVLAMFNLHGGTFIMKRTNITEIIGKMPKSIDVTSMTV